MPSTTALPILPTPGLNHPRLARLRFMTADAGAAATPGAAPAAPAPAAPAAPVVDPAASGSTPPAPAADPAPQAGQEPPTTDSPWSDPVKAQAEIERLRRENAAARTNAKTAAADEARQELAQTIGKALGLVKDDTTAPDPAALATAAQEAANEARAAKVELAAFKAASMHGANPVELLDRRSVTNQLDKLDPTADDFATQVDAIVKKAVTDNPQLLVQAPVAGSSSTDHAGGSGEVPGKPKTLEEAVAAKLRGGR